jgi:hypothetical protein
MTEQEKTGGTMNCGVVSELLESYHAGKLNPRAEESVREHLESCAACAVRLASVERKSKASGEHARVFADEGAGGSWFQRAPKLALLAIAVAVIVVPSSFWYANARSRDRRAHADMGAYPTVATLRRVGDDETRSVPFTLESPKALRVYALGEGIGGEMYDYGWIIDAETRRTVWSMEYGDTDPAGGDDKNRLVDEVITLRPGRYLLQYKTDGSHSFEDWNADPPRDEEAWGITLTEAAGARPTPPRAPRAARARAETRSDARGELAEAIESATAAAMEAARVAAAEAMRETRDLRSEVGVVARLVGVGDDEDLSQEFSLERESRMRVYAVGEGTDGEMYDYAWIEDSNSGRTVWRMTYRDTRHAGGAEKNRMIADLVVLPAGEYVLRYRSDDSHSYDDWNMAAPHDTENYGVTLIREGG